MALRTSPYGEDGDAGGDGAAPAIRRHLHDGRILNRPPGDRLCLGLECLEDAIPLFLDDIVHDSGPFPPAFRAGLNEDCRHVSLPDCCRSRRALHKAKGSNRLRTPCRRARRPGPVSAPRLARPLRGGEQRFTVRHHAEGLLQLRRATVHNASANDGIIFPGDDLSLARVDPGHRLAGHLGEGADLSFQGCRLGGEVSML
jgi:hypothetical protein